MELTRPRLQGRGFHKRIKVKCVICRYTFYHKPNFKARTCGRECSLKWQDVHKAKKNLEHKNIKCLRNMFTGQLERYHLTI